MEIKKIINISPSFSAVTNINSWRVKSALSNVVSLLWYYERASQRTLFKVLKPQDQDIGEYYVVEKRRAADFEAPKLWKGSSGCLEARLVSSKETTLERADF